MNEIGELGGLARAQRTVRTRCGATPAACEKCFEVFEVEIVEGDIFELVCPSCRDRWHAEALVPCPRPAVAHIVDADGIEDDVCIAHGALWRRLAERLGATATGCTSEHV